MRVDFDNDQDDIFYRFRQLFKHGYPIHAKAKYLYSDFQLATGIPYTGYDYMDSSMGNEINMTLKTPYELALMLSEEIPFYFVSRHDIKNIFDGIVEYLKFIIEILNKNYISAEKFKTDERFKVAMEDLILLEKLANHIAQPAWKQSLIDSGFSGEKTLYKHLRRGLLSRHKEDKTNIDGNSIEDYKRVDMTEHMTDKIRQGGQRIWRTRE